MKLANIVVSARLKDNPAAIFKVNHLSVGEDDKSLILSSLNGIFLSLEDSFTILDAHDSNTKQGYFDHCFDQSSSYEDVAKGTETSKILKQLLHGYNAAILSLGVGDSDAVSVRGQFIIENLRLLQRAIDLNAYRYNMELSFGLFGVADSHCVNLLTYQKTDAAEISYFLKDWEGMMPIDSLEHVIGHLKKGYNLPVLVFVGLRSESKNELERSVANKSILALGDLGSLHGQQLERSLAHLRSIVLTLDQKLVSGELRVNETPLTQWLAPFIGGNANTAFLFEFATNSSLQAVMDAFMFADSLRSIKNRIEPNFENVLVNEVESLTEENVRLDAEKAAVEKALTGLNWDMVRVARERDALLREYSLLSTENEAQRFLLEYNATRLEVEQLELKEKIRSLHVEMVGLDHQRAMCGSLALEESLKRRRAEIEARKAIRSMQDCEQHYQGQLGTLRERISKASDELQRSVEERSMMQSKLQHSQSRLDQLTEQLRDAETSRARIERNLGEKQVSEVRHLESEISALRHQLEAARQSERALNMNAARIEGRSEAGRREISDLERELRALRSENSILQSKLESRSNAANAPTSRQGVKQEFDVSKVTARRGPATRRKSTDDHDGASLDAGNLMNSPSPAMKLAPVSTPSAALLAVARRPGALNAGPDENSGLLNLSISSALNDPSRKKIKLPDRPRAVVSGAGENQEPSVPKATPVSAGTINVDPQVMTSIMSNFNVKLPAKK